MKTLGVRTVGMGAVAAVLLLGACGGGEDRPGQASSGKCGNASGSASVSGSSAADEGPFTATEATTKVAVTLHDYMFDGIPATLKGPRIYFDAKVTGSNCHEMEVLGSDGKAVGEIPAFPSTEKKHLALELKPGTYTVQCLVKEGAKTHADLGMKTQFVVE